MRWIGCRIGLNRVGSPNIEGVSNMALKRNRSNIINLNMIVASEDGKSGMTIDQTIINGQCAKVAFRVINCAKKSAAISLDHAAIRDLAEALQEVLATSDDQSRLIHFNFKGPDRFKQERALCVLFIV